MNTPRLPTMVGATVLAFALSAGGVVVAESAGADPTAVANAGVSAEHRSITTDSSSTKRHRTIKKHKKKHHRKHRKHIGTDTPVPDTGTPPGAIPGGGTPDTA